MSESRHPELEQALRRALRPIEPPSGFEERVAAAIEADSRGEERARDRTGRWITAIAQLSRACPSMRFALGFAAATVAAVAIAAGALTYRDRMREASAERTQRQALEALRIASEKLDSALRLVEYQTVEDAPRPARDGQIN